MYVGGGGGGGGGGGSGKRKSNVVEVRGLVEECLETRQLEDGGLVLFVAPAAIGVFIGHYKTCSLVVCSGRHGLGVVVVSGAGRVVLTHGDGRDGEAQTSSHATQATSGATAESPGPAICGPILQQGRI